MKLIKIFAVAAAILGTAAIGLYTKEVIGARCSKEDDGSGEAGAEAQ